MGVSGFAVSGLRLELETPELETEDADLETRNAERGTGNPELETALAHFQQHIRQPIYDLKQSTSGSIKLVRSRLFLRGSSARRYSG